MRKIFFCAMMLAAIAVVGVGTTTTVDACCGNCGCGSHSDGSHSHGDWNCGWCDTHSDHDCVMNDDHFDQLFENFNCPLAEDSSDYKCSSDCKNHHLTEAIHQCPSLDDQHVKCSDDCLLDHLVDSGYFDESFTEIDDFAFCHNCVNDLAKYHADRCCTDCSYHNKKSCDCCNTRGHSSRHCC